MNLPVLPVRIRDSSSGCKKFFKKLSDQGDFAEFPALLIDADSGFKTIRAGPDARITVWAGGGTDFKLLAHSSISHRSRIDFAFCRKVGNPLNLQNRFLGHTAYWVNEAPQRNSVEFPCALNLHEFPGIRPG
ncbi:hypothetical protein [Polaromonas sp. CG_23.6]|uniref:hypothetical protein n=1 Tax=Polaromonas sp. CG_23.6 TaxID=2760709 RepID=UPI0024732953|nr:hypothetical protein [Polaromonas sp. CG_23.6]MDH6185565.1 hypothetical protein [Polaromonas sp. CG_23.6]